MTSDRFHLRLRALGVVLLFGNLLACLLLDTREWIVYFDPWFWRGIIFPTFVVAIPALPFLLPRKPHSKSNEPPILLSFFGSLLLFCEALWLTFTAIATFCRDSLWTFYWPWEERGTKFFALNNVDLSEYVWVAMLGKNLPADPLLREWPGIALLAIQLVLIPLVATVLIRRRTSIAWWRILAIAFVIQIVLLLLIKIVLLNAVRLKYIVSLPEIGLSV